MEGLDPLDADTSVKEALGDTHITRPIPLVLGLWARGHVGTCEDAVGHLCFTPAHVHRGGHVHVHGGGRVHGSGHVRGDRHMCVCSRHA